MIGKANFQPDRAELLAIRDVLDKWVPLGPCETKPLAQRIDDELSDYFGMMAEVSKVYDTLTRSRISKPNTLAVHVISEVQELHQRDIDEAVEEAQAVPAVATPSDKGLSDPSRIEELLASLSVKDEEAARLRQIISEHESGVLNLHRVIGAKDEELEKLRQENAIFARALGEDSTLLRDEVTRRREAFRSVLVRAQTAEAQLLAKDEALTALTAECAEAKMGHVRLDECSDGIETRGLPLYDRISKKIEKFARAAEEQAHVIAACAAESDILRGRANAAEHRRAAAEYRAQRIVLDGELKTRITELEAHLQAQDEAIATLRAALLELGAENDALEAACSPLLPHIVQLRRAEDGTEHNLTYSAGWNHALDAVVALLAQREGGTLGQPDAAREARRATPPDETR